MIRVWVGVGFVAALLLAGVATVSVRGTAVAGTAVAAPEVGSPIAGPTASLPGATSVRTSEPAPSEMAVPVPNRPPQVGDCLIEEPYGSDISGSFSGPEPLASLRLAACTGARHGEVVWVGAGTDRMAAYTSGAWQQCYDDGRAYLGSPDPANPWADSLPAIRLWPVLLGPDAVQRAAGQDWSACVLSPPPSGGGAGANYTVDHSLRDAWDSPSDQALFASCMDDENRQYPMGCLASHRLEEAGYWSGDPDRPADEDLADCRDVATAALGSSTHLDSGALTVFVVNSHLDAETGEIVTGPAAVAAAGGYIVDCMLAPADPAGQLTGPLRGLGDQPVPSALSYGRPPAVGVAARISAGPAAPRRSPSTPHTARR